MEKTNNDYMVKMLEEKLKSLENQRLHYQTNLANYGKKLHEVLAEMAIIESILEDDKDDENE